MAASLHSRRWRHPGSATPSSVHLGPQRGGRGDGNGTRADILPGIPRSAICVQRFDDSLNSAIHITYRSWLRSSSMHEPRDPPLKIVLVEILESCDYQMSPFGQIYMVYIYWVAFNVQQGVHHKTQMCSYGNSPLSLKNGFTRLVEIGCFIMILPQVHLRKPCYDFYFL